MAIPMVRDGYVFDAITASETKQLVKTSQLGMAHLARSILLEINGGSTPDWTLDIQGKVHSNGTFHNIDYFRVDQGAVAIALSAAQLAVNWTTARYYVIPNPPPFVRFVAVRTGGTLTVGAAFSSEAYAPTPAQPATGALVDTELPTAVALSDALANPTAPAVGAYLLAMKPDASAWERVQEGAAGTGTIRAALFTGDGTQVIGTNGTVDGIAASATLLRVQSWKTLFNGTTWDRERNNIEGTLLASAARTATTNSADQTNYNAKGVLLILDVTATPNNAETLTVALQVKDPISGKYVTMTAFTALTASVLGAAPTTETYVYTVYPGAVETAAVAKHEVQGLALPRTWRAQVTHSAGGSWTYSLAYVLIN